jgi:hypothetical protein
LKLSSSFADCGYGNDVQPWCDHLESFESVSTRVMPQLCHFLADCLALSYRVFLDQDMQSQPLKPRYATIDSCRWCWGWRPGKGGDGKAISATAQGSSHVMVFSIRLDPFGSAWPVLDLGAILGAFHIFRSLPTCAGGSGPVKEGGGENRFQPYWKNLTEVRSQT